MLRYRREELVDSSWQFADLMLDSVNPVTAALMFPALYTVHVQYIMHSSF